MYPCCLLALFRSDAFRRATTRSAAIIAGGEAPLLTNAARSGASPEKDPQGSPDEAERAALARPCLVLLVLALPLTGRTDVGVNTSCALPPIDLTSAPGEDVASVVLDWEPSFECPPAAFAVYRRDTSATAGPKAGQRSCGASCRLPVCQPDEKRQRFLGRSRPRFRRTSAVALLRMFRVDYSLIAHSRGCEVAQRFELPHVPCRAASSASGTRMTTAECLRTQYRAKLERRLPVHFTVRF